MMECMWKYSFYNTIEMLMICYRNSGYCWNSVIYGFLVPALRRVLAKWENLVGSGIGNLMDALQKCF
jgi:hypothetical protein